MNKHKYQALSLFIALLLFWVNLPFISGQLTKIIASVIVVINIFMEMF